MTRGHAVTDETTAWLLLHRLPGFGSAAFQCLLDRLPRLADAFALGRRDLRALGLSDAQADAVRDADPAIVAPDLEWLEGDDNHLLRLTDSFYPSRLRDIARPPPLLFVRGEPRLLEMPQLGMVGSRNPTPGGADHAFEFSRHLSGAGFPITSGLALGIDAAAHEGALAAGGVTIAVVGTGLDRVYPARHRDLAHRIAAQGAIVSEFPIGTGVRPENFPRRNRIISGLSLGVLVVEASLRSGSLTTARYALEQGREVFAIPGSIHNPLARGCHALIRQGAKLVETATDIIEELPPAEYSPPPVTDNMPLVSPWVPIFDPEYYEVLEAVGHDPVSVDTLVERTRLTAAEVSSILLTWELEGEIATCSGGRYVRVRKGEK